MAEQEKQDNQKTIVAFAAGLLIGGLLVWVFGGATPSTTDSEDTESATTEEVTETEEEAADESATTDEDTEEAAAPVMQTGTGAVELATQTPGTSVALESATFPSDEGWIGVRDYADGQLGGILGVARFSKEQGLVPQEIVLQRATKAGSSYAIVFFSENGDRVFNLANDVQVEGIVETFTVGE